MSVFQGHERRGGGLWYSQASNVRRLSVDIVLLCTGMTGLWLAREVKGLEFLGLWLCLGQPPWL